MDLLTKNDLPDIWANANIYAHLTPPKGTPPVHRLTSSRGVSGKAGSGVRVISRAKPRRISPQS